MARGIDCWVDGASGSVLSLIRSQGGGVRTVIDYWGATGCTHLSPKNNPRRKCLAGRSRAALRFCRRLKSKVRRTARACAR